MNTNPLNDTNIASPENPFGNSDPKINETQVTLIQSAIRGYQARNEYRALSSEIFLEQISIKSKKLLRYIQKLAEKVEMSFRKALINQETEIAALNSLEDVRDELNGICDQAKVWDMITRIDESLLKEVKELFSTRYEDCDKKLRYISEDVGFPDLKSGMKFLLGSKWKERFSEEALDLIKQFNKIFTPTAYSDFEKVDADEIFGMEVRNMEGNSMFLDEAQVQKGLPFTRAIDYFRQDAGIDTTHGGELLIPYINEKEDLCVLALKGHFKNDPINSGHDIDFVQEKLVDIKESVAMLEEIPETFRENFLAALPLRDILLKNPEKISEELQRGYDDVKSSAKLIAPSFIFKLARLSLDEQVRLFSLLLMLENTKPALFLYALVIKESAAYQELLRNTLHYSLQKKVNIVLGDYERLKEEIANQKNSELPLEDQILMSNMSDEIKQKAFEKVEVANSKGHDSDRAVQWLRGILKVPFGVYSQDEVTKNSSPEEIKKHLNELKDKLDAAVYGQEKVKQAVLEWRAQKIANGDSNGECFALEGPPGLGKTTFAKKGLAKALGRPFAFLPLGGRSDASYLVGHGYTYTSAVWGKIVQILQECGSMDPVIYVDEPDKAKGEELMAILAAATDPSQNKDFQDAFYSGIPFDLSKVLWVFSYNYADKLDPVFKDRLKIMVLDPHALKDKLSIARKHMLPEIFEACGFEEGEITFSDEDLKFIVEHYTYEAGARKFKENLFSIVRQINLKRLTEPESISFPHKVDRNAIIEYLEDPKIEYKQIAKTPSVGRMNGLYATSAGIGGITIIENLKIPANNSLDLTLTGSQGDVMKESMRVAKSVALDLIPKEVHEKIKNEDPFGLHIHCPEGATPKDGPSAGGAITTSIISRLMGIPIKNDVAMTGEINLNGQISKIGGLNAKLHGAKKAGVRLALIPRDNEKDFQKVIKKDPDLLDDTFDVKIIDTIHDALDHALVRNPIPRPE